MNRIFRTLFIFLILLTTRGAVAQPQQVKVNLLNNGSYNFSQTTRSELDELNELEDFQHGFPLQPSNDFELLMSLSITAQDELGYLINQVSMASHTQAVLAPNKDKQRAQIKIDTKFAGQADQLTDLVRASIVADDVSSLISAYEALTKQADVVQLKNRFAQPKASGYRDLNALVRLPHSGMIVEVQFHLNNIADIKSGPEHDTYVQIQAIELQANREHRPLTDYELHRITKLRQDSHKLYHKAWLSYKRQHSAKHSITQAA
ncbi:GTP pyrophosphokinase [Shewanella intestini]|uniref:GTP pyrophosphokinase n=1 Tax=Shewanella intestini TaxID=2017544 RepID=A0ABS5I3A5_9GAMM|nr:MULTISPECIES: GTP pyrophosphokinase [Shewanella]MBR9728506.1 GTP pyrophosphokinase [Shewanella intestini]MRG36325.1 GTP pyrophosphokinase [Shewanella sp. XMDDZSB0408]